MQNNYCTTNRLATSFKSAVSTLFLPYDWINTQVASQNDIHSSSTLAENLAPSVDIDD